MGEDWVLARIRSLTGQIMAVKKDRFLEIKISNKKNHRTGNFFGTHLNMTG
jgi:hypothetical protein